MFKNFIQDCLDGEATIFDLDDYVDYWHENDTGNTLQQFLGLNDYEYEQWGVSSDAIFRDIIRCRQDNLKFSDYKKMSESERIAARSYNQEDIDKLKNNE